MAEINLGNDTTLNATLSTEEPINAVAQDVNYIPGYKAAEEERRANEEVRKSNENDRINYYDEIQRKVNNGEFNGRDGAIQYTAGTGISIEDGVISNTKNSATWGQLNGTLADQTDLKNALDGKANVNSIPTKVSELQNDSNFIDNTVNNLTNYYAKNETYSKNEVDSAIGQIPGFNVTVVQTLPTTNIDTHTIYLKPKTGTSPDIYDEYIYTNNSWELIGNTEVDLSNYYTKSEVDTALSGKQNTLTSGTTIKTINSVSVLGSGDIRTHFVPLIAVDDTAPAECATGDKYFNTTTNLIYTATGTDTWSSTGESPIEGIFYIVFEEQTTYAYNETTLVSVGGGAGSGGGDNEPIGKVVPMALETAPDGYLLCDGSIYTKTAYPDLYKALRGTVYQLDDVEFQVPNIQGKVIVGKKESDTDFAFIGRDGGSKAIVLQTNNLNFDALTFRPSNDGNFNVGYVGTGGNFSSQQINQEAFTNLQPYTVLNYFIKAQKLSGDVVLSESLPVGTEVEFDGQASDIPVGWEEVDNPIKVFSGSTSAGNASQINTTWEALGKFNFMIIELYKSNSNTRSCVMFPYFLFSNGNNLNENKRNTNIVNYTVLDSVSNAMHIIPGATGSITTNTITFDSYSSDVVISAIYIYK